MQETRRKVDQCGLSRCTWGMIRAGAYHWHTCPGGPPLSRLLVVHKIPNDNSPKYHRMLETRRSDQSDPPILIKRRRRRGVPHGEIQMFLCFLDVPDLLDQLDWGFPEC